MGRAKLQEIMSLPCILFSEMWQYPTDVATCCQHFTTKDGEQLLSVKSVGSFNVECKAKPFKHCNLTKGRNDLSDARGVVLFRCGQNLRHLHCARKAIKGKVYTGVLGADSTHDAGVNAMGVSQDEVDDEKFD
jgi:hypothetical protein